MAGEKMLTDPVLRAIQAYERHAPTLMKITGVVGVGIEGDKIMVAVQSADVQIPADVEGVPIVKFVAEKQETQ